MYNVHIFNVMKLKGQPLTFSDGSCQCCLAVINMADGPDVDVWLVPLEGVRVPSL